MYQRFYELQRPPFSLVPDPEFLYLGGRHGMAFSLLEYGLVNESGFIVLTGEPGTGKTTLLNRLVESLQGQGTIGVLNQTPKGMRRLLPWVLAAFGQDAQGTGDVALFLELARFLARERAARRRVLLVVDEAQNIGAEGLEELRLLSNLHDGRRSCLQIILAGQPGLRSMLQGPGMVQLAQRIGVEHALDALFEEELRGYVEHRIRIAGGRRRLFSTLACRTVYTLAGGTPRLINQLCDRALVHAYAEQAPVVTGQLMLAAAKERDRYGIFPFHAPPASVMLSPDELEEEQGELAGGEAVPVAVPAPAYSAVPSVPEAVLDPERIYREIMALKPLGEFEGALALCERLENDPDFGVRALAQKGLCLRALGRYEEAIGVFRDALSRLPTHTQEAVSLRYVYARTLEIVGCHDDAIEEYCAIKRARKHYRDVEARLDRLIAPAARGNRLVGLARAWPAACVRRFGSWGRHVLGRTSRAKSPPASSWLRALRF